MELCGPQQQGSNEPQRCRQGRRRLHRRYTSEPHFLGMWVQRAYHNPSCTLQLESLFMLPCSPAHRVFFSRLCHASVEILLMMQMRTAINLEMSLFCS